jgi:hypothetical protein
VVADRPISRSKVCQDVSFSRSAFHKPTVYGASKDTPLIAVLNEIISNRCLSPLDLLSQSEIEARMRAGRWACRQTSTSHERWTWFGTRYSNGWLLGDLNIRPIAPVSPLYKEIDASV